MDVTLQRMPPFRVSLQVPPDKAIAHRAVLAGALAHGATEIIPWPSADDCQRTLGVVEGLGVAVRRGDGTVTIHGRGREALRAPSTELCCGESGTTFRLSTGLLAGCAFRSRLAAGPSLSRRPMRRIVEPLTQMGARFEGVNAGGEWYPPLTIQGSSPLRHLRYELPVASAQVKSAVLLAGLAAQGETTVVEPLPTRDHTERILRHFGIAIREAGPERSVTPGPLRSPGRLVIPGDFSSAAFFVIAALCVPGSQLTLTDVGLNPTRIGLLQVLRRMGATVRISGADDPWEPRGTLTAEASALRGIMLEPEEVPGVIDELPALMVACTLASGRSRLRGLGELRVKETDRIRSLVQGLAKLGAAIRVIPPDQVEIDGGRLVGARVDSAGDHRTAMSLAVAGLMAEGTTTVTGAECVTKSFPSFFDELRRLGDGEKR